MSIHIVWSLRKLVKAICDRLLNRFDVFLVIEGKRGLGKSTLGFRLMLLVKREMMRRGIEGYRFSPRRDLLYTRQEVLKFFHKRKHSGLADEMINVSFNRDFYNEDQKDLIKMINMNRDHNNLFIACVPQFKNLDNQIKQLSSIKITVVRRGLSIIHMPNKTVYSADIWDENVNQKIEREWLKGGGVTNPRYSRLTTFRGFLKFPKLTTRQEELYQKIKDDKRNIIAQGKGLDEEEEKKKDPFYIMYNSLIEGKIKNVAMLEGMMMANGFNISGSKSKLIRELKKNNKPSGINKYFFDDGKTKDDIIKERKKNELTALIEKARSKIGA